MLVYNTSIPLSCSLRTGISMYRENYGKFGLYYDGEEYFANIKGSILLGNSILNNQGSIYIGLIRVVRRCRIEDNIDAYYLAWIAAHISNKIGYDPDNYFGSRDQALRYFVNKNL